MRAKKPWYYKEVLVGLYVDQQLTIRQIGQIFDLAPSTVLYWLRKHEIKLRDYDIGQVNLGKTFTEEERQHLSELAKERFATSPHPRLGKKLSEQTKTKIRVAMRQRRRGDSK